MSCVPTNPVPPVMNMCSAIEIRPRCARCMTLTNTVSRRLRQFGITWKLCYIFFYAVRSFLYRPPPDRRTPQPRGRARAMLGSCTICPHDCGNNRLKGEIARCYSGELPVVSAYTPHFGEEPALWERTASGTSSSGTAISGASTARTTSSARTISSKFKRNNDRAARLYDD